MSSASRACFFFFFFFFKNDERKSRSIYSFSRLLTIARLNAFRFVASVIPPCKSPLPLPLLVLPLLPLSSCSLVLRARDSTPFLLRRDISPRVPLARKHPPAKFAKYALGNYSILTSGMRVINQGGETTGCSPCISGETRGRGRLVCCFFRS